MGWFDEDTERDEEKFRSGECPRCDSHDIEVREGFSSTTFVCNDCQHNLTIA
ncbi:hypothetical protein [Thermoflavimicrobium dichotomicum]|uniref:Uncharacterized protein n=1 Tax=Thermoflavimicrobium dichotomicum TaxID=46223 RepID=A0A1I3VBB9_9BACL|nr:hypothetical protein [Thermoflavimicrobium dichotomicum]SFJ92289.1 hypothetical protein SAMN05421852_1405 [Thermoflavimicrobium dichotomicum]